MSAKYSDYSKLASRVLQYADAIHTCVFLSKGTVCRAQMFYRRTKSAVHRLFRKSKVKMFMAMKHNKPADGDGLSTLTLFVPEEKIKQCLNSAHNHYGDRNTAGSFI